MNVKRFISGGLYFFEKFLPNSALNLILLATLKAQGRGWKNAIENEIEHISRMILKKNIKNVIAVDAGANKGDWSLELIKYFREAQVYAFEPSTFTFMQLERNLDFYENVKTVNSGLGSKNEKRTLFSNENGSGFASLSKRNLDHFEISFDLEEKVEIVTLDNYFSQFESSSKPNVLKIDVEGHELDVLLGSTKTLNTIEVIQFEMGGTNISSRTYFLDFWLFFRDKPFHLYRVGPNGLQRIDAYSETDEIFLFTTYFAIRD